MSRSTRPRLNEKLLRKTLQHIEENPKDWDQASWRCGTQMCFAGHACDLQGAVWDSDDFILKRHSVMFWKKEFVSPGTVAEEALGLTYGESSTLFSGGNSIEDLRLMVDWIIARRRENSSENILQYAERVGSERAEFLGNRDAILQCDMIGSIRSANGQAISILPMPMPRFPSILDSYRQLASHVSEVPFFEIRSAEPQQPALDETDQAFYEAIYDTTPDEERTEESEEVETQEELPVAVERP